MLVYDFVFQLLIYLIDEHEYLGINIVLVNFSLFVVNDFNTPGNKNEQIFKILENYYFV